jgi:hypothetical protein
MVAGIVTPAMNEPGILIVWTGITEERDALFNGWYNRQHLSERTNVPGFCNGRRYKAVEGSPAYLAWYELESPAVFTSAPYAERQNNPTGWTQAVMPGFRDVTRVAGVVKARLGQGLGGACASWRLTPAAGAEAGLTAWLADEVLPALLADNTGVLGAVLAAPLAASADAGATSNETRMRAQPDNPPCWGLLVECADLETARAVQAGLDPTSLATRGVLRSEPGIYALVTAVGRFDNQPGPDPEDLSP